MTEDYGDRLDRHEAQLAELQGFTRQLVINNERLTGMQLDLSGAVGRLERHMEDVVVRLERIEHLLERMLPGSSNGPQA